MTNKQIGQGILIAYGISVVLSFAAVTSSLTVVVALTAAALSIWGAIRLVEAN